MARRSARVAAGVMVALGPPAMAEAPRWSDETAAAGLDFVHFNGMTGEHYFPEIMGAGGALFDHDGDGDLDLFLAQGRLFHPGARLEQALLPRGRAPVLGGRLYRNDLTRTAAGPRVRFTDVTAASGLAADGLGMGAAVGDYDGDGDPDLYLTFHGPNQLWRNNGDGTFTDVTAAAGVGDPGWTVAAVFVDFDRDGDLDLLSVNYVEYSLATHKVCQSKIAVPTYCSPSLFAPQPDRFYRNRGDGTFEDATRLLGLDQAFGPGLGAVAADLDGDGWIDLYVANDGEPNQLWINQQGKGFRDQGLAAGVAVSGEGRPQASMGVEAEDFDGDGDLDLFMTHLDRETNALYVNEGDGLFTERGAVAGLGVASKPFTGFGTSFLDYDNDGDLDLLVVNGGVSLIDELYRVGEVHPYHQRNQLFENLGEGRLREVTEQAGPAFAPVETSRAAIVGDVDNDGDLDVVVTNNAGPARLLVNRGGQDRPWIGIRAVTRDGRRDALGARVELERDGTATLVRRVRTDGSYAAANDPRVLFGVGDGKPQRVVVRWPDGAVESWPPPPLGRYTTLRQGAGTAVE
jgi:hypothetical protein